METSMSRILVETVVKTALKDWKEDPERNTRKLIDWALHFSGNDFQKHFFETVQTMLQDENSAYYGLIRDLASYADVERLFCFGMNLGYNSCTCGLQQIQNNEKRLGYQIPWTVLFQMDARSLAHFPQYDAAVADGEKLGIYTWMLFLHAISDQPFELAHAHPDSAFVVFCGPGEISDWFLDHISGQKNVMPVIPYEEGQEEIYTRLRALGIPYSVFCPYSQEDLEEIRNGDLFFSIQQVHPVFTILIPHPDCPDMARRLTFQAVERARKEHQFQTIPWELERDHPSVAVIRSEEACAVSFDSEGFLWNRNPSNKNTGVCLFQDGLHAVLRASGPKN